VQQIYKTLQELPGLQDRRNEHAELFNLTENTDEELQLIYEAAGTGKPSAATMGQALGNTGKQEGRNICQEAFDDIANIAKKRFTHARNKYRLEKKDEKGKKR